jgi:repressor LexA
MTIAKVKPKWATAIKERREELGKSQEDVAFETEISQSLISQIERGVQNPMFISTTRFYQLLNTLQWTPEQFTRATGLELPSFPPSAETLPVRRYRIPIVEAGAGLPAWNESGEFVILDLPELRGKPESELFAVRVRGDSMSPTYLNGDVVVCWTEGLPEAGRVVAVHQHGDGIILKRLRYIGEEAMLYSDNPAHPPVPLGEYDRIYGVALGMWRPAA